ncbi:DUF2220 family protein [Candidatus Venteria ishoeyi]|uniref:DUF3322 domain-containing protein n=1 Tax=Candidatus Venteria ishoeyi TaxID=1899563 RepID=UPI0025A648E6|nr:Wadjet anti-phage system protein JetD domain-containing protein [Candidatus Venteria ishoeyi]MDM8547064.1 DUF2220 family protein [Candidatus Venteria ishoeyi]
MQKNKNKRPRWTHPSDIRTQLQKQWQRGGILSALVMGKNLFPKRLAIKTPSATEMLEQFEPVRAWIEALRTMPHCRVEMREFKHKNLGKNTVPQAIWFDGLEDLLAFIGKHAEVKRFMAVIEITEKQQPALLAWLAKKPLRALALLADWSKLMQVLSWMQTHPRPGLYLRQISIPGIHTKFIEIHRGVLAEWLDLTLPANAIDFNVSGVSQFTQRYGFRDKPLLVRFRLLDPKIKLLPGNTMQDISLDADSFAALNPAVSQVFITENEINFLAFPAMKSSLIIFGKGYGFEMLHKAHWLRQCRIYYWGDIDTHGFAILSQLRSHFPEVKSLLMERKTLLAFKHHWGKEDDPTKRELSGLSAAEQGLYDDLRNHCLQENLRLEQEKIAYDWIRAVLRSEDKINTETGRRIFIHFQGVKTGA